MTLSPKLGVLEISTLWHFRLPLLIQMFIKVASSPRLSGIGMPSPNLWSHLLKMRRIVLLSSLLWWELGTNSLITGPGEWLLFRRFTSKLSWGILGHMTKRCDTNVTRTILVLPVCVWIVTMGESHVLVISCNQDSKIKQFEWYKPYIDSICKLVATGLKRHFHIKVWSCDLIFLSHCLKCWRTLFSNKVYTRYHLVLLYTIYEEITAWRI